MNESIMMKTVPEADPDEESDYRRTL